MDNYWNELTPAAEKQLKENRHWFQLLGISLVALGSLAIVFGFASTLITVMFIGIFLAIYGVIQAIKAFKMSKWSTFFLNLFLGVLYFLGGLFAAFHPMVNALTLTVILAIFFMVSGFLRIFFAFRNRLPNKLAATINGILSIVLGVMLWYQWPVSGLWAIGTILGIDAIVTGWSWIILAWKANSYSLEESHN